jgi:hypothetical protein
VIPGHSPGADDSNFCCHVVVTLSSQTDYGVFGSLSACT